MARFSGKTVVVAGATSGVGRSASVQFAREGAQVVMLARREDLGHELEGDIRSEGLEARFFECDWTDPGQVDKAVAFTSKTYGNVNCLYNHAGTVIVKPFLETTDFEWRWLMDVNVLGMVRTTRAFLPLLLENETSAIVNMASISGVTASALESAYYVTKGACIQLTRAIAVEFRDRGVRCNAVCPGFIRSEHGENELSALAEQGSGVSEQDLAVMQGRICEPDEVAQAVLFLASDHASFVNGEMLTVDNAALAAT